MHHLGQTRSAHRADHILQTPDTFVRAPLPGMQKATAIVHAAPAIGARFTQYTAEFEAGGSLGPASVQRFVYVLDGELNVDGTVLVRDDYAYFRRNTLHMFPRKAPRVLRSSRNLTIRCPASPRQPASPGARATLPQRP